MSLGQSRVGAVQLCTHKPGAELVLMFLFLGNILGIFGYTSCLERFVQVTSRGFALHHAVVAPAQPSCSLAQDLWAEILGDGSVPKRESQGEHPTSQWTAEQPESQCHQGPAGWAQWVMG